MPQELVNNRIYRGTYVMKKKTVSILLALALTSTVMLGGYSKDDTVVNTVLETSSIVMVTERIRR